ADPAEGGVIPTSLPLAAWRAASPPARSAASRIRRPPMTLSRAAVLGLILGALTQPRSPAADWAPAQGPLMTRWAKDVRPDNVLPEYPRPQMVRKEWANLNGLWQYAVRPKASTKPDQWDGQILVPFPIESALSGVMKRV